MSGSKKMLDPQEIRKMRQERLKQAEIARMEEKRNEARNVFQWILKLFKKKIEKGCFVDFDEIDIYQCDGENELICGYDKYPLYYNRDEIFPIICEIINAEEGYNASYKTDAVFYDDNAWILTVKIK